MTSNVLYNFVHGACNPVLTDSEKIVFSNIVNIQQDKPFEPHQLKEKVKQYEQERENPFQKVDNPQPKEPRPPCRCGRGKSEHPYYSMCLLKKPVNLSDVQTEESIPQGQLKEKAEQYAQERKAYDQTMSADEKRRRPVINGDVLLARPSFSGKPSLTFQDGSQPFFGFQQEPHPIKRAVDKSNDYTGVKTFTVDGIAFSVDFTQYKHTFLD